jgi:hypothetical protein
MFDMVFFFTVRFCIYHVSFMWINLIGENDMIFNREGSRTQFPKLLKSLINPSIVCNPSILDIKGN